MIVYLASLSEKSDHVVIIGLFFARGECRNETFARFVRLIFVLVDLVTCSHVHVIVISDCQYVGKHSTE